MEEKNPYAVLKPIKSKARCQEHVHLGDVSVECDLEVHDETVDHEGWVRASWQTLAPHTHLDSTRPHIHQDHEDEKADDPPEDR